jgi:predicted DNA-binding transcriptional regulator AlpA
MDNTTVRLPEMKALTGLSRTAIYDRMNEESPRYVPDFPKSFSLGGRAVGWAREEVHAWLQKCKAEGKSRPQNVSKTRQTSVKPKVKKPNKSPNRSSRTVPELSPDEPSNLAEAVVQGSAIIAKIQRYLDMDGWTPAMGSMLLAGLEPPENCEEIPRTAVGLNGQTTGLAANLGDAMDLLRQWRMSEEDETEEIAEASERVARGELERTVSMTMSDGTVIKANMKLPTEQDRLHKPVVLPTAYLYWCQDSQIEAKWLPIFLGLVGCRSQQEKELAAARVAMMMAQIY